MRASRPKDLRRAKYELAHTVRVHLGCEDDAFGCMGNGEDSDGIKARALLLMELQPQSRVHLWAMVEATPARWKRQLDRPWPLGGPQNCLRAMLHVT